MLYPTESKLTLQHKSIANADFLRLRDIETSRMRDL